MRGIATRPDRPMKTALLVIDVQQSFTRRPYFSAAELPAYFAAQNALIAGAQAQGWPIVRVFHRSEVDDAADPFAPASGLVRPMEGLRPFEAALTVHKTRHSALVGTGLDVWLVAQGVHRLVVSGIRTEQCCETTARHASDLGWQVGADRHGREGLYNSNERGERRSAGDGEGEPWATAFGDSFTHGDDVPDAETWISRLSALGLPTVNAGVPGYGVDQAWLRYRQRKSQIRSRVILIGVMADNIARLDQLSLEVAGAGTSMTVSIRCANAEHLAKFVELGVAEGTARTLDNLVAHLSR